jgi:carbohydrate diacid regulator
MGNQFKEVAIAVTQRVEELLGTQVFVVDDHGIIIASSNIAQIGRSVIAPDPLRIPLRVEQASGEVVIPKVEEREIISPRLAKILVELVISQVVSVARFPNQHELKNKFIHDLLRSSIQNEEDVLREAQILGMDFSRPRTVVLIDAADYLQPVMKSCDQLDSQTQRRIQLIIGSIVSFFHLPSDTICAYIGGSEIAVLKASSNQDLAAWINRGDPAGNPSWANLIALKRASHALLERLRYDTNANLSIGIGRYHPGISGLARSYQDAKAALSLGHHFLGKNQVYCLDDLGIAAFVGIADEATKIDLAKHLLTPLDQEPELIETLRTFFSENCYPSSTASQLSIHRNTLSYRLDKITSLTGLNPRLFDDAVQIRLALLLRSMSSDCDVSGKCTALESQKSKHVVPLPNVSCG